ncbi:MAG TPA: ester cyclase [Roseiflexaceae bacterium]|nr:ester cyclase [Roseiflexaceae bacterium]
MATSPADVVRAFFSEVRSGRDPDRAVELMAPLVLAHQVVSEEPVTVERTPQNYADHVREMQAVFGRFELEISELLADGDRVYVRWRQTGRHMGEYDGFAPTGLPLVEIASAVYRVADGRIVEYWIQIDRAGLQAQLERNARAERPTS